MSIEKYAREVQNKCNVRLRDSEEEGGFSAEYAENNRNNNLKHTETMQN